MFIELHYTLWKQYVQVDEWRTANPWQALGELYANLISVVLQHWLIVLFACRMSNAVWLFFPIVAT